LSNVAPTAPCIVAFTGGLSLAGGAIGFGGGKEDINCSLRETARSFAGLGLTSDAIAVLCASEHAAVAPTCMELKARKPDEDSTKLR
jgi:vacuolar-type H+-ATPase subunit B/Vma2